MPNFLLDVCTTIARGGLGAFVPAGRILGLLRLLPLSALFGIRIAAHDGGGRVIESQPVMVKDKAQARGGRTRSASAATCAAESTCSAR